MEKRKGWQVKHKNEFQTVLRDDNGLSILMQLRTNKWTIELREAKGHIHATIRGPNDYRRQGLSAVTSDLTQFELKVTALHFYRLARDYSNRAMISSWIDYVNYAEIFGSCFE